MNGFCQMCQRVRNRSKNRGGESVARKVGGGQSERRRKGSVGGVAETREELAEWCGPH